MMVLLRLKVESWRTYKRGSWVGLATPDGVVRIRRFVAWLPVVGLRVLRHELDHLLCADFRTNDDHHDAPAWSAWHSDREPHYCGRSFSWRGFFTHRHLRTPASVARRLRLRGRVVAFAEEGSIMESPR